jgi:two-component system chemotaxis response regulator CheY
MAKKTILLIDDSAVIARQLQKILDGSKDFEVIGHALNGMDGIKLFSILEPDIVLMDVIMPEMDGLQAMRTILSISEDAKIVVVSSTGGVSEKTMEALKFGAKSVISKPFEAEKVLNVLKGL